MYNLEEFESFDAWRGASFPLMGTNTSLLEFLDVMQTAEKALSDLNLSSS